MLPPPTLRRSSDLLRETAIETPRARAASSTSDPAAMEAKIAMRGTAAEDEAAVERVVTFVRAAFDSDPAAATPVDVLFGGAVCVWRFATCFFFGCVLAVDVCALVAGGGADVVTGVVVVAGGGLLVVVGGGGGADVLVGGGGGGGGVPATATEASARPAASATAHPTTDPMTLVALNVPPARAACPGRPAPRGIHPRLAGWESQSSRRAPPAVRRRPRPRAPPSRRRTARPAGR